MTQIDVKTVEKHIQDWRKSGNQAAIEDILNIHKGYIVSVLKKCKTRPQDWDDAYQAGQMGVIEAVEIADLSKIDGWKRFAYVHILRAVLAVIRERMSPLSLSKKASGWSSVFDINFESVEDPIVANALRSTEPDIHLDEDLVAEKISFALKEAGLTKRELAIVKRKTAGETFVDIGADLGLSSKWTRLTYLAALEKMKKYFAENDMDFQDFILGNYKTWVNI